MHLGAKEVSMMKKANKTMLEITMTEPTAAEIEATPAVQTTQ